MRRTVIAGRHGLLTDLDLPVFVERRIGVRLVVFGLRLLGLLLLQAGNVRVRDDLADVRLHHLVAAGVVGVPVRVHYAGEGDSMLVDRVVLDED